VARGLSFADAVTLLGGSTSRTVAALDRLAGGMLLAASATGVGFAATLFDPKLELARLSGDLVLKVRERMQGVSRLNRTERLTAAHAVLVLTAYFEMLGEVRLPFNIQELKLTAVEQVVLATESPTGGSRLAELAKSLLRVEVPTPAPQRPYEEFIAELKRFYWNLSGNVGTFVAGLAVWDELGDGERQCFQGGLRDRLPDLAVARFEELFRRLASAFTELAFWMNQLEHQATRTDIRRLSTGLAGMEKILAEISTDRVPNDRCSALANVYQAALDRPILPSSESPEGLQMPLLGEAYVNPDFRVKQMRPAERIVDEYWWHELPVRDDLQGFLLGHLTTRQAVEAPLLVLGQPGSGKSMLTQILAARLPPSDFIVVRVVLREVSADADLQTQIEQAVRTTIGEQLTWPAFVRSADGALPVILLDGFDELLQATGVSQSDYLEKVADFQRREADLGRAVVMIVTSRTAVADRARPPRDMIVVRLEPFRDEHIAHWLATWRNVNESWFSARDLRPPTVESMLDHRQLACQPLLLLMLALYDADSNALQRQDDTLGQAELYERLLTRFAEREIRKTSGSLSDAEFSKAIDRELLRLSIAAFAMFNRRRQWVTQVELDADLSTLINKSGTRPVSAGLRAELTAAQLVIGRFFFIHRAQAVRDETLLQTYEFLHATFGEYLIGRLLARELNDLADTVEFSARRLRSVPLDGSFLRALLSFAPLTMRGTVVSFLAELMHAMSTTRRELIGDGLLTLFHTALHPHRANTYEGYEPDSIVIPARYAAYSANLVLLAVLARGKLSGRELFLDQAYPVDNWRCATMLWRSQLPSEGWLGLLSAITLSRDWDGSKREIQLRPVGTSETRVPQSDPYWSYRYEPNHEWRCRNPGGYFSWVDNSNEHLRMQSHFQCDTDEDILGHALEPLAEHLGSAIVTFHEFHDFWPIKGPVSAAHALIRLWLAANMDSSTDELITAHQLCLQIAIGGFAPYDVEGRNIFRVLVLRQLKANRERLPVAFLRRAVEQIQAAEDVDSRRQGKELARLTGELFPELLKRVSEQPDSHDDRQRRQSSGPMESEDQPARPSTESPKH
jgi:hypothetical protein